MFRMPAEFERHRHTWVLWPERPDNWRDAAEPAQQAAQVLVLAISQFEPVVVGASRQTIDSVRRRLPGSVRTVEMEFDDTWIRDTGPICVVTEAGGLIGLDWEFNSWGGLFASWARDNDVPRQVLEDENLQRLTLDMVLEGGAIQVDGEGTLLTTEECLLRPDRNPGASKRTYEDAFREYFGVAKTIWLPSGVVADETGGHVDNMAAFIGPGRVALAWTDDTFDPQYERSLAAFQVLSNTVDARGRKIEVIKISLPEPLFMTAAESEGFTSSAGTISRRAGDRLAASYVNFYFVNGGLILPSFGCPSDQAAADAMAMALPDRHVLAVPSREFVLGGGGPHCLTQQIPMASKA